MLRLWHLAKFWQRERILKKCRKLKKLDFLNKAPKCDSAMRCYPQNPALLRLKKSGVAFALLGFGSLLPSLLSAASSTTPPVGYVKTTLLANSDTFIGASLTRPPAYVGTVLGAAGSGITVSGEPQWEIGAFTYVAGVQPNTYYVRLGAAPEGETNPFEGRTFTVEVGGASDLIVTDPLNGDLSTVPAGTKIEVIPYWTLNTLFPPEDAGVTFEESQTAFDIRTQVILQNSEAKGINKLGSDVYFFFNEHWRKRGESISSNFDDVLIELGTPLTIRGGSSNSFLFYLQGQVRIGRSAIFLRSEQGMLQDNVSYSQVPFAAALNSLGLVESGAFEESLTVFLIKDLLLLFSNEQIAINKLPVDAYYYYAGGWRKVGGNINVDFGLDEVSPNTKIVVRKAAGTDSRVFVWQSKNLQPSE